MEIARFIKEEVKKELKKCLEEAQQSSDSFWTKISTCNRWKVSDVCIRPNFTSDAAQLELELYFSCLLPSFSFAESTGKICHGN